MHLPSFAVFTLLCISHLTDAAPVATAELAARGAGQSTPSVPPTAQEMISQGMINTPRKGRAFFWSDKGNALVNPIKNKGLTKELQDQFWDNASEAFAELTTGQVTLMLEGDASTGPPPDSDSVSQRIERPVLEQRLAAGLITGVDRIARDFATTGTKDLRNLDTASLLEVFIIGKICGTNDSRKTIGVLAYNVEPSEIDRIIIWLCLGAALPEFGT
ncbi:hypothetical protein B0H11DRAFT_1933867 [Mycena galericulata]|nr:hypothetical protein B0H11DRAFT_1933867 [Mycena galericulata]